MNSDQRGGFFMGGAIGGGNCAEQAQSIKAAEDMRGLANSIRPQVKPMPSVGAALEEQADLLSNALASIDNLEHRLQYFLRPSEPVKETANPTSHGNAAPLEHIVFEANRRIVTIISNINEIAQRIPL